MIAYTFIRSDIPLQHQIVQVGHSCYEAGYQYKQSSKIPYLIVLDIKDSEGLSAAEAFLKKKGYKYHKFFEPDNNLGYTSITTEPLEFDQKRYFSSFPLWRAS